MEELPHWILGLRFDLRPDRSKDFLNGGNDFPPFVPGTMGLALLLILRSQDKWTNSTIKPFPQATNLQQTALENTVAKEEIAHNEQLLLLPQCFQLYLIFIVSFLEIFHLIASVVC